MAAGSQTFYCSMSVLVADLNAGEDAKERPFAGWAPALPDHLYRPPVPSVA